VNLLTRYWQSLSPALQRYYFASVWPCVAFMAFVALHEWAADRQPGLDLPWRICAALSPLLALAWLFATYLRFLRDCDELERRLELGALAWAAGIALHAGMAAMFLLNAGLADWAGQRVAAWLCMLLLFSYALIRGWLHRRYA